MGRNHGTGGSKAVVIASSSGGQIDYQYGIHGSSMTGMIMVR
jgi:hypothetical protein